MDSAEQDTPSPQQVAPHETREAITRFLFVHDSPAPVDLSFVLGCPDASTVMPAVQLYLRRLTCRILISGMGPQPQEPPESELAKAYAVERGVPDGAIYLESRASNTLQNFVYSRRVIANEIGWGSIHSVAITGKPFHMRRALMTARMHWPSRLKLLMIPSGEGGDPSAGTWWQTERGRKFVLAELEAIGRYALRGHLGGF
jgi:hypothetical protein